MEEELSEGGSFTVTGCDSAVFKLPGKQRPKRVHVRFDGSVPPLVCNPHHHDELRYELVDAREHAEKHGHHWPHKHHYELRVFWHVAGLRTVCWDVSLA